MKIKTTFCIQHDFPMATDSSNHRENIVGAISHINKEKLYLDSIKEIIYCYDNIVCCSHYYFKFNLLLN